MRRHFLLVKRLLLIVTAAATLLYPSAAYGTQVKAPEDETENPAEDETKSQTNDGAQRLPKGVFVENIDIGGMTRDEARRVIDELLADISRYEVCIGSGEKSFLTTFGELGAGLKDETVVDEICSVGRRGSFSRRFSDICTAAFDGLYFKLEISCDTKTAAAVIESHRADIDVAAKDAVLVRKGGAFIMTPETPGQTMNTEATAQKVCSAIEHRWRDGRDGLHAEAVMQLVPPKHTSAELSAVCDRLGAYETSFAGSPKGRIANIKNGAAKLENTVVYPGEEYSFLQAMKPFSEENGYHVAGTYVNGRNTPGLGGGICQVSSTLYNAVLRAELTVTERTNHMMTVGYVPLGADATIANPSTDFKFRNDSQTPVLIEAYTSGTMLYVNIYGKEVRPENRTIEFVTVTEETVLPGADVVTYDSERDADYFYVAQNAHTGYTAAFYKNIYVDGHLTEQILVNRSIYGAYPRYVVRGSG